MLIQDVHLRKEFLFFVGFLVSLHLRGPNVVNIINEFLSTSPTTTLVLVLLKVFQSAQEFDWISWNSDKNLREPQHTPIPYPIPSFKIPIL